jgi:site-specific DNA-methyltransferase (adenine-specific)/modification methylase
VTPYYSDDLVTIYHSDCREWMPEADVIVTDPPYGIGYDVVGGTRNWTRKRRGTGFSAVVGDSEPFDPAPLLLLGLPMVLFGANHYASRLPDSPSWMVWYKRRPDMAEMDQADAELAWTNLGGPARVFQHVWVGGGSLARENGIPAGRDKPVGIHPTQKPLSLMRWVIGRCPEGTILDPFAGSGSTLVAAKSLGRKSIGIEIEERYCEIAARRCSQEVLGLGA